MNSNPEHTPRPRRRAPGGLTEMQVRRAKPSERTYKLSDGGGMALVVPPSGSRWWRYDYRFAGRRKTISLGIYPDVSLAKARERHREARAMLADDIDPSAQRRSDRVQRETSFAGVADAWHAAMQRQWTEQHAATIRFRLDRYLKPTIGDRPITAIEPPDVLAALRPIEDRPETAQRVKMVASQVFRWAVARGLAKRDPTADLRGALPAAKGQVRAAITEPRQVGALMRAIDEYQGQPTVRAALQLAPLLFVRPGELRSMEWAEIDFGRREWRIPAEKMKMRDPHVVPLARQAVAILEGMVPLTGRGRYVFPSIRSTSRPISANTLNGALRRLGYGRDEMCAHGFRALASSLLNEQGWPTDVIERQLAHAERNKVRAVYNRAQYLGERRRMMQSWADYLDGLADGAEVVTLHGGAA